MAATFAKKSVPGLKRMATPGEIAVFALALASNAFPYTAGSQIVIDSGKTAHARRSRLSYRTGQLLLVTR
jgi:hypothetical protein